MTLRRIEREPSGRSSAFPSVEVFPQFRCTHNAERTYAHILLDTFFRSPPLSLSLSFSVSLSLTFASLLLGLYYQREIISLSPFRFVNFEESCSVEKDARRTLHARNRKYSRKSDRFRDIDRDIESRSNTANKILLKTRIARTYRIVAETGLSDYSRHSQLYSIISRTQRARTRPTIRRARRAFKFDAQCQRAR